MNKPNDSRVPESGEVSLPSSSLASRLLAMPVATVLLFLLADGLLHTPCWGLPMLVAVAAWPVWHYQQEYLLFQRRAVLARATHADSGLRRWLWAGTLSRGLQVIVALAWASLLLAFGALLKPEHWMLLALDTLLLALMVGPVRRRMARQVREREVGVLARRWPLLLLNLVVLSLGFLLIDFFVLGAADTRGLSWHGVIEQTLSEFSAVAACPLVGLLVGLVAAVERLTWHLWELLVPSLPGVELKLAAWALLLLQAGVIAYAFTRLQLGVVGLLDARKLRLASITGDSSFSKAFVLTILLLALPYFYALYKLRGFDPSDLQAEARQVLSWANPCVPDEAAIATLEQGLDSELESTRMAARQQAGARVDATLDSLFEDVRQGVDHYLDWYFTVIGEYERLAAVATGDLGQLMGAELERHLFDEPDFSGRLAEANQAITADSEQQMMSLHRRLGQRVATDTQANRCGLGGLDLSAFGDLGRDGMRASASAGGGALLAVASSKLLAKKTAAAVVGKVAAKKSFTTAAALIGKGAAKKGGSVLLSAAGAAALCAPGGPLAVVCGVAVGAATWLAIDKALVEVDEAVFREQMRDDILAVLEEQRGELASSLKEQHYATIDAMAVVSQRAAERLFIPARDGL